MNKINKINLLILASILLGITEIVEAFNPDPVWEKLLPAIPIIVAVIAAFKKE